MSTKGFAMSAPAARPAGLPAGRGVRLAAAAVALAALGAVFLSYLDPHLARELASRAWACF